MSTNNFIVTFGCNLYKRRMQLTKLVYAHDGTSTYDELFLNSFKERYDVYVLTFHPSPTSIPRGITTVKMADLIHEIHLHPFEGMRKHLLTFSRARTFKKKLAQIRPDVLVGCWASTYGFYAAQAGFHPFVLFVWGSDIQIFPKKYFPLKPLVVYSLEKADIVVLDSDVQRNAAIKLGCAPEKIVKFPWVDLKGIESSENQRLKIRTEYGWTEDEVVVISMRSHRPVYGVGYLIDAIPHIARKNQNVKFLILGEGPLTKVFETKAKPFVDSGTVRFVGSVSHDKVADFLSAADIYVSTSFSDGTSASLLEAMACNLAPVVTEIDGNKEWITNSSNGLLFPVADSQNLAEKILLLAKERALREKLRTRAEETVKARVDWQQNMQELTRLIEKRIAAYSKVSNY
jgi:glycosyltransferase involved in cell wall biosynthesis